MNLYKELKLVYEGEKENVHIFGTPCKRRTVQTIQALPCDVKEIADGVRENEYLWFISPEFDDPDGYLNHPGLGAKTITAKAVDSEHFDLVFDKDSSSETLTSYTLSLSEGDTLQITATVEMYDKAAKAPSTSWILSKKNGTLTIGDEVGETKTISAEKAGDETLLIGVSESLIAQIHVTVAASPVQ